MTVIVHCPDEHSLGTQLAQLGPARLEKKDLLIERKNKSHLHLCSYCIASHVVHAVLYHTDKPNCSSKVMFVDIKPIIEGIILCAAKSAFHSSFFNV